MLKHIDRNDVAGYDSVLRSVAQPGSAPGLGPGGPRFESLYSDHFLAGTHMVLVAFKNTLDVPKLILNSIFLPITSHRLCAIF